MIQDELAKEKYDEEHIQRLIIRQLSENIELVR